MYLKSVEIQNIKSSKRYKVEFDKEQTCGWHVLIGDNGSGKSTLAKSIALGLIGEKANQGLREDWSSWIRKNTQKAGIINLEFFVEKKESPDFPGELHISKKQKLILEIKGDFSRKDFSFGFSRPMLKAVDGNEMPPRIFSASYGPFRRFSGGSREYEKLQKSFPWLSPHLSLFGEDVALTECLEWIQKLRFRQLENKKEGELLDRLKKFINQEGLLPDGMSFHKVSSDEVGFRDSNRFKISVGDLSDGYRSILSMTFDLIRQIETFYANQTKYIELFKKVNNKKIVVDVPGIVIIDEIDTHLHPSWQKRIGYWFTEYFPKIQFIVTTHSPIVCHAAENGSVWRLSSPGSSEQGGKVDGIELKRLLYGNITEALDTELFGKGVTRSESSQKMLERMAELNLKSIDGEISKREANELDELRTIMPTAVNAGIEKGRRKK